MGMAHELVACDVWSLGVLFVYLLTGRLDVERLQLGDVQDDGKADSLHRLILNLKLTDTDCRQEAKHSVAESAIALVSAMLQQKPERRPSAQHVWAQMNALVEKEDALRKDIS